MESSSHVFDPEVMYWGTETDAVDLGREVDLHHR
jgi:hypothetical protein